MSIRRWMGWLIIPSHKYFSPPIFITELHILHFSLVSYDVHPTSILPILDFSVDFIVLVIYEMLRHLSPLHSKTPPDVSQPSCTNRDLHYC